MRSIKYGLVLALFLGCGSKNMHENKFVKYFQQDRFLVKIIYDSAGKVMVRKYFNRDTVADGAEIHYYPNGIAQKWEWFNTMHKNPCGKVFYDPNGLFDTIIGTPFVSVGLNHQEQICIEMINPPDVQIAMGYRDFFCNTLVKQILYDPSKSDTTAWVVLDRHKPQKGHVYMLYYYFLDYTRHHILGQSSIELENKEHIVPATDSAALPFVGRRGFETRPGCSGTGTPHRAVEITKNGDVFFFFEQENQADKTITKERYYAGKFNRYMKCAFKKLDAGISYYEFTKDTIYEVDEHNNRLKNNDCCDNDNVDDKKECTCKGAFFSISW